MNAKTVDRLVLDVLADGYREEIVSLLKYRKLAASLERLYGLKDLSNILQDEERHAKLFLDMAKELDFDIAEIGEQALIKELNDMAQAELKISDEYKGVLNSGTVSNKRVLAILGYMIEDSKRHHRTLTELSERLVRLSNRTKD